MNVEPTALRREARVRKQALEEAIRDASMPITSGRVYDPYHGPVVKARQALRAVYVALLLSYPFTRAAQLVDSMIWSDTTYSVVSYLRGRLAKTQQETGEATNSTSCQQGSGKGERSKKERGKSIGKPNDQKRLTQVLLRFITEELEFYQNTIVRLAQLYALKEAQDVLDTLGIRATIDVEDPVKAEAAKTPAHRHQLFEILQRMLTCMGDLLRYRELHSAARTSTQVHYNFTRAVLFYHEAHTLLPDYGNPSNQLAVVAICVGDTFGAMYQYYRALCVRSPFENARFNLQRLFEKALQTWTSSQRRDDVLLAWRQAALEDSPAIRVPMPMISARWESTADFLWSIVEFHSLCFLRADFDTACILNDAIQRHLLLTVDLHELRAVDYLRMLVSGMCASWTARLCRAPLHERLPFSVGAPYSRYIDQDLLHEFVRHGWETMLVCHVLGILTALLSVNRHELMNSMRALPSNQEQKLLDIGRVLRRTLPTVRIGLKWVKGHLEYIASCRTFAAITAQDLQNIVDQQESASCLATDSIARFACIERSVDARIASFWSSLIDFVNLLRAAYPFDLLPNAKEVDDSGRVAVRVAEDDDLRYLGPIRRSMHHMDDSQFALPVLERHDCVDAGSDYARVIDIMVDVKVMAESDLCGLAFDNRRSMFVSRAHGTDETDDPVDLAMRAMDASRTQDSWSIVQDRHRKRNSTAPSTTADVSSAPSGMSSQTGPGAAGTGWPSHLWTSPWAWSTLSDGATAVAPGTSDMTWSSTTKPGGSIW